ncbi:hypothetical protein NDU88_003806 [Pleurodeles waltl]|uniref:Uncharacterized protein n=1 Tax=Pleurodeles waltl TaxID=8319 RepID=A0AAV7M6F5_PLEWA|nr:hypothetical protein NDU88_003806 [Pleurodeles waltl]
MVQLPFLGRNVNNEIGTDVFQVYTGKIRDSKASMRDPRFSRCSLLENSINRKRGLNAGVGGLKVSRDSLETLTRWPGVTERFARLKSLEETLRESERAKERPLVDPT